MSNMLEDVLETAEDTQKGKYLIFTIGKEEYGIEIRYVTEIVGIQAITVVPELDSYIKGVINLRGKIIPVMDVRIRFKKEERAYDDRTCIIVVEIGDISVGLIVDRVSEVLSIPEDQIVPPPEINKGAKNRYINAIGKTGKDVKLLIDCRKLLNDNDIDAINEIV